MVFEIKVPKLTSTIGNFLGAVFALPVRITLAGIRFVVSFANAICTRVQHTEICYCTTGTYSWVKNDTKIFSKNLILKKSSKQRQKSLIIVALATQNCRRSPFYRSILPRRSNRYIQGCLTRGTDPSRYSLQQGVHFGKMATFLQSKVKISKIMNTDELSQLTNSLSKSKNFSHVQSLVDCDFR